MLTHAGFGFKSAQASVECFEDDGGIVVRMDFDHPHDAWLPGQHFFLTFPALSVWQSHPFTVASCPNPKSASQHHTYIIRARNGETSKLATLAKNLSETRATTPVILMGPYGTQVLCEAPNILALAGGTGISFIVPLAAEALRRSWNDFNAIKLVWVVRQARDVAWMMPELQNLKALAAVGGNEVNIHIFVSRESRESCPEPLAGEKSAISVQVNSSNSSDSGRLSLLESDFNITWLGDAHPNIEDVVSDALNESSFATGSVQVVASGPAGMGSDLRKAVASHNDAGKVWKGQERHDVSLHWDDRMY